MKFGLLPPVYKPAISLLQILRPRAVLPPLPDAEDYIAGLRSWRVLGNKLYGDCVPVAIANHLRAVSALLGKRQYYPSTKKVLEFYATQNPGFPNEDGGMVLQLALERLVKVGWSNGRRAIAFAEVEEGEVDTGMAIFGTVILGITVQAGNMEQFKRGETWTNTSTEELGAHAVMAGGYPKSGGIRVVTWGKEITLGPSFIQAGLVQQRWVVIEKDNLGSKQFLQGIDLSALESFYRSLTGRILPVVD